MQENSWMSKRKAHSARCGTFEQFASTDLVFRDRQKEIWKEELQEIVRKGTELLPEHQKMQKRSQKLQSLQDKQRYQLQERWRLVKKI